MASSTGKIDTMKGNDGKQADGAKDTPSGHLLILACSQRKKESSATALAVHLYDGVNFRVLRKVLLERGWPPGLQIKILSAKYGLIDARTPIEPYDQRLDKDAAARINARTLAQLTNVASPAAVFVNLGKDYLPAVDGLEGVFPGSEITFAEGPIGMKMSAMKRWLEGLAT